MTAPILTVDPSAPDSDLLTDLCAREGRGIEDVFTYTISRDFTGFPVRVDIIYKDDTFTQIRLWEVGGTKH